MKFNSLSKAVLAVSLLGAAAAASAGVTGGVAFTSDYLFRGISQSSNNAAVQGTLSYAHDSGFYATAWGSSIAYGNKGGTEIDTLFGYAGKAGDLGYDVGVMRYNYPGYNGGSVQADYNEVYGAVSIAGAKFGLNYSPDYFAESDKFVYAFVEYGVEVSGINLFGHYGFNKFDSKASMQKALGTTSTDDSYADYKLAASKAVEGVTFELAYIGSDIDDKDLAGSVSEGRFVLTASKSF